MSFLPIFPNLFRPARTKEKHVFATIRLSQHVSAQGHKIADHGDGRVTICTGRERITGWPVARSLQAALVALVLATFAPQAAQAQTLLNVSYDPTRELYRDYN